ncbi:MAG: hypothetical protein LC117_08375 [Bacteroidia bacterium]|nr:hypothetical protein [Bacteroidia bacterium]MCZ2277927.1 hypothetical protein [Bacteroidia bacterium]
MNKKMKTSIQLIALLLIASTMTSCKKDEPEEELPTEYDNGYIGQMMILNEGAFGNGNGSVDFINPSTGERTADVFNKANNQPLGDVVQSAFRYGNQIFIVVNNSQKIEVVHPASFKRIATITGVQSPRYILPVSSSKAYISDWGDNSVKIVSLGSYSITGSIPVNQNGPEQMAATAGKLFVVNGGGFSDDSTVTVIDIQTDQVITTLTVGVNPNSIVKDENGKLWILCGGDVGLDWTGGTADDIAGSLYRINPDDYSYELIISLAQDEHPLKLTIKGSKLYFLKGISGFEGEPMVMNITDTALPSVPLISKTMYGLGVNPDNGDIYGCYSPFFGQSGYIFRYSHTGGLMDSVKAGIAPSAAIMNK